MYIIGLIKDIGNINGAFSFWINKIKYNECIVYFHFLITIFPIP